MIEMLFSCGHSKGLHFLEIASPLLYMFIRSFIPALYLLNVKPDLPNAWTLGSYGWNFGARILHRFGVVEPLTFWISNSLGLVLEVQRATCNFVSGEMIENALFLRCKGLVLSRNIFRSPGWKPDILLAARQRTLIRDSKLCLHWGWLKKSDPTVGVILPVQNFWAFTQI